MHSLNSHRHRADIIEASMLSIAHGQIGIPVTCLVAVSPVMKGSSSHKTWNATATMLPTRSSKPSTTGSVEHLLEKNILTAALHQHFAFGLELVRVHQVYAKTSRIEQRL